MSKPFILESCPCCGSPAAVRVKTQEYQNTTGVRTVCTKCGLQTKPIYIGQPFGLDSPGYKLDLQRAKSASAKRWNKRPKRSSEDETHE